MRNCILKFIMLFVGVCLINNPTFAKEEDKLSKNLKSANFSLQVIRNNWTVFQRTKEKDVAKTIEKYRKIIAKGSEESPIAKLHLGDLYSLDSPQYMHNPSECARLVNEAYDEISAAYPNERNLAACKKGDNFYKGYGVKQNLDSAFYYYSKAAAADDFYSGGLAMMYLFGDGVEQDIPKSIVLLDNMVRNGNARGYALQYSASFIDEQLENETLDQEAYELWRKGVFLYLQDFDAAMECYKKAADRGFAPAQFEVGTAYVTNMVYPVLSNGDRDPRSYEEGLPYLEAADAQGFIPATNNLGVFLEFKDAIRKLGIIVGRDPQNEANAYVLYRTAADQGFPDAQVAVGIFHMYGYGPADKNYEAAYTYFAAAARQGNERGKFMMKELENLVREERRKEIEASVRDFNNELMNFGNTLSRVVNKSKPRPVVATTASGGANHSTSLSAGGNGSKEYTLGTVQNYRIAYNTARRTLENYKCGYWQCTPEEIQKAQASMREIRQKLEATGQWKWGVHAMETWNGVVDD